MNEKIDEIKERVLQYRMGKLPGQPMITHMGTSYLIGDMERIINALQSENAALTRRIGQLVKDMPNTWRFCPKCGYDLSNPLYVYQDEGE